MAAAGGTRLVLLTAALACAGLLACGGHREPVVIISLAQVPTPNVAAAIPSATSTAPETRSATIPVAFAEDVPQSLLERPSVRALRVTEAAPAVLVSRAGPGQGFAALYWIPATALFNDATALSLVEVGQILRGELTDWKQVAASPAPVTVSLPVEHAAELRLLLGEAVDRSATANLDSGPTVAPPVARWRPEAEILSTIGLERGAFTLLPLEDVDYRERSLALGGVDLLRGTGDVSLYPLATRLSAAAASNKSSVGDVAAVQIALSAALPAPERLLATGDIIPARCVYAKQKQYNDYRHAFLEVAGTLHTADLAIGSLDASISDKGVPVGCRETLSLMAPAESIQGLTFAGISLLTVAANHAKDCGEQACGDAAFLDTLERLDAAGIAHTGGGKTLAAARAATVLNVKGIRFAFLGYNDIGSAYYGAGEKSPGTAPLDLKTLDGDVRAAHAQADVVIVMVHWGTEYTPDPTDRQRAAARIAVAAGATLVIGNHPHVVQAIEALPGGFAAYALGNFVFDQDWSQETLEGVVMETVFDGTRLRQVSFLPLRIQDMHQPHFVTQVQGRPILNRMLQASLKLAAP